MKVIICEDNVVQLEHLKKNIENYAMMEGNGIEVVLTTTNPNEVIAYEKADCYFLDIDLNHEMTGLMLGDMIRKRDPLCNIIFVTTHAEMTYLTFMYKIAALDFIIKDHTGMLEQKVLTTLKVAYEKYLQIGQQQAPSQIQIRTNGYTRNIAIQDIYFFAASPTLHKIILHLENEHIEFYGRLKDFKEAHASMYQCHKAFIVNRQNIEFVDYKERVVYFKNGETCFASARLIKGLK
ncbi:LytR/AlgR family response regulator transcription factor [Lysinibacillus xylanilyticus]|uniref:LytR/AlgR family response regulator transcription factor n=1 Tax=Lysinibacillus xylanilyticus TaxID=582475 RepID=UPI003D024CE6